MAEFHHRLALIAQLAADIKPTTAGEKMGISGQMMRRYSVGKNNPSLPVLTDLKRLGVSVDWLISGEGEMFGTTPRAFRLRMNIARRVLEGKVSYDDVPEELWLWILDQWVTMQNDGSSGTVPLIPELERILRQRYKTAVSSGDVDELVPPSVPKKRRGDRKTALMR